MLNINANLSFGPRQGDVQNFPTKFRVTTNVSLKHKVLALCVNDFMENSNVTIIKCVMFFLECASVWSL